MYLVNTIGALGDASPVMAPQPPATVDAVLLAGVAASSLALGAIGFWFVTRKKRKRRRR